MSNPPITIEQFRGLRLLEEKGEAAGAIDMLNCDLQRGQSQVGTRGGLSRLGTGTAAYHYLGLAPSDTKLYAYRANGTGVSLDDVSISSGTVISPAVTFASASRVTSTVRVAGSMWIALRNGASNAASRSFDGASASTLAYSARYFAHYQDRLVAAHYTASTTTPSGANGSTSTLFFSDPGVATTFDSSNWLELDRDNGEEIAGMVVWEDALFVLKQSALYVFNSTSIDATGLPLFEYRRVNLPARARATHDLGGENIIAGSDGVYLVLSDGVYRTTGGVPGMISRNISPLFDGTGDSTMRFPSTAGANWTIGYAANRLFLSYTAGSSIRTLVFDSLLGEWLVWDISAGAATHPTNVLQWLDTNGVPAVYVAAGAKVFSFTQTATSDDGTAIVSSYQPGFDGLGFPMQEKKIRRVRVHGSGSPTVSVLTDFATTDPLSRDGAVTLGTAPAIGEGVHAKAYRGRMFSPKLSAASGVWTVTRLALEDVTVRPPGLRSG